MVARKFGNLTGTNPCELLRSASALEGNQTVGRLADYAAAARQQGPAQELHESATSSVLERIAKRRDDSVVTSESVLVGGNAGLSPGNVAKSTEQQRRRKRSKKAAECTEQERRKCARIEALGSSGSLPTRSYLAWDWKGQTTATGDFECRVVMQGSNVLNGMQFLMDHGIMEGPLPHYVQDAAILGKDGVIQVENGAVVNQSGIS